MQSLTVIPKTKKFELAQRPIPEISRSDQVLIKVSYAGFYESDLQFFEENADEEKLLSFRMELSGTIVDIGKEVTLFKKGDRVTLGPNAGCGCCYFCRSGKPHFCSVEVDTTVGTWSSFVVVPVSRIHKVPDNVTLQQVILAKSLSHLINGWHIVGPITIGMNILITGAGFLGSVWTCVLYHQGHRNVTISDDNQDKLNSLKRMDTGFFLTTRDKLKETQKASANYYFDLVIETSGNPSIMEHGLSLLQKGGKLCCCQMASPNVEFSIYPFEVFMRELNIFGVRENCFSFQKAIKLIEAMGNRYLNYESSGIKIFPLKQYKDAVEAIKRGSVAKVVFSME